MSVFSTIWSKIQEVLRKMIGSKTIESTLKVTPAMSSQMENAINLWTKMYKDEAPWLHKPTIENPINIVSLGLPALIASEKARMVVLEMKSEITTPTEKQEVENPNYTEPEMDVFGNLIPSTEPQTIIEEIPIGNTERAEYLQSQYSKLLEHIRPQLEYGIAKGGLVIKPYVVVTDDEEGQSTATIEFDFVQADAFYPLAFDASGHITEAAFIQTKVDKNAIYRRLEYHKWANNTVKVINKAFKSTNSDSTLDNDALDLGKEIALTDVPEWSSLQPEITITDVLKPLFAYFKMPQANTIDMNSPLGVSGYSRATSLIKQADLQFSRLLWEYEGGELAIDIDRDALNFTDDESGGHSAMAKLQNRLYRPIDLGESNTYQPYAPPLRDTSYTMGLNTLLMRIEDVVGISRGTLSDVTSEAKTATELKILKQRSFSTNSEIQKSLENTLRDVIYIMNVYATLYEITPEGDYDVSFEWDDSIINDVETELGKRITLMQNGLTGKVETRMWYFGETERQAQEALQKIQEESVQSMEQNLVEQSNLSNIAQRAKEQSENGKEAPKKNKSNTPQEGNV